MKQIASLIFIIITVFAFLNQAHSSSNIHVLSQSQSINSPISIEFIRQSCSSTLYPTLCFTSLVPYASTIHQNPLKLAQIASSLSLTHIKSVKSQVSSLLISNLSSTKSTISKALHDCTQVLSNAADQTQKSMAEIKKLKAAGSAEFKWCLSNVQTWMSAALTNEDTCTGGLKEGGGAKSSVASYVSDKVGVAEGYTSIALALVNKLEDV